MTTNLQPHPQPLLIELFVEELPPKALKKLGESFASSLHASLVAQGLCAADAACTTFASPRRLGALIANVAGQGQDKTVLQKLMPAAVGLAADGSASPALVKKLAALGAADMPVSALKNDAGILFLDSVVKGATLAEAVQKALDEALAKLPIPKVMQYQLPNNCEQPGWTTVSFVRPAHGLVALHGADIVSVAVLGLQATRSTQGHRFEAAQPVVSLAHASDYEAALETQGAVIASFAKRRAAIVNQLAAASGKISTATGVQVTAIEDDALLDEVTALVERPNVLVCAFEKEFLDVPQECLILTMKANQKYFPLLDAAGKLSNQFLIVSNINPADSSAVIQGNERVVRPRLADAKFFYDQDRKKTLASRIEGLNKVVYHNKLGTQGQRTDRVAAIAHSIGMQLGGNNLAHQSQHAALLAKCDLLTDMVGEFPELQGTMGRYYALHDGEDAAIADAIEDHYKPRFAGDNLPRGTVGTVVALADKLETLVGMFGIGAVPTGDKDPFALRRHALGVIRLLSENKLPLALSGLIDDAAKPFGELITHPLAALNAFISERLAGQLREQGNSVQAVDAVLSLNPAMLYEIPARLAAVKAFADLPEAPALAAANKRVGNILKKIEGDVPTTVNAALLHEPAEQALNSALQSVAPVAQAAFKAGNYTASLQALAALKTPVDAFFDSVMVNAEDAVLRANRQGLLAQLHAAMNQVADLSKLAA
jgi:glycyl-tRNA synthetase beta chain